MNELRQRHGCVSFWLWLVIIVNLYSALVNSIAMFGAYTSKMSFGLGFMGILGVVNILSAILLMRWNRLGFYMLIVSSIIALIVNIVLLGVPSVIVISSIIAIIIWWAILQIRKNGVSAWKLMSDGWDYKHCRHLYQFFIGIIAFMFILTVISSLGEHKGNPYERIIGDNDMAEIEPLEDDDTILEPSIDWKVFRDNTDAVSVEAPDDFRRLYLNDDHLMALGCSDYDPYITIVQEPVANFDVYGVTTTEEYSQLVSKMLEDLGGTGYRKLSGSPAADGTYIAEYELSIEGSKFYYKIIMTKTKHYFYYCQVLCLDEYKYKLEDQIEHIIKSFKVYK